MHNKLINNKRRAFTLVELLIVIAIIGILFIVLVSKVDFATDKAKATGVQTDFRSFQVAIESVAKEHAGLATFGWDTGDTNGDRVRNSYDKGDTNQNGKQDPGEVFVGSKTYGEDWTNVYTLTNPADANDKSAIIALEEAINKNLDPKLHITINDDLTITMANGAKDPWDTEYHGYYITNAANDNKDRGAIIIYSNGANQEFGSEHYIMNGQVTVFVPGNNTIGADDYSIAVYYTSINGYGEVQYISTGFNATQPNVPNVDVVPNLSVDSLQKIYDFQYFESWTDAVDNINGENTPGNLPFGAYENDGERFIVLMHDVVLDERILVTQDINFNLGGHTLKFLSSGIYVKSGQLNLNGTLKGSNVLATAENPRVLQVSAGATLIVDGGTYAAIGEESSQVDMYFSGTVVINDAIIDDLDGATTYAVYLSSTANVTLNNTSIYKTYSMDALSAAIANFKGQLFTNNLYVQHDHTGNSNGYGIIIQGGNAVIKKSTIKAFANYSESQYTVGVYNNTATSNLDIYDSYIYGCHGGVISYGPTYISGGTYEGYGNGGLVLAAQTENYIENATFKQVDMQGGYLDLGGGTNGAAIYVGTKSDVIAYINNCRLFGKDRPLIIGGLKGQTNISVYISNTTLNDKWVRMDSDTHKLYIGIGCNITAENTQRPDSVVITNETYTKPQ